MSGVNIIGVQFRRAGKIYDFDGSGIKLAVGDQVVVETERGLSLAQVMRVSYALPGTRDLSVLKPISRVASTKDLQKTGRMSTEFAESFTKEKIKELKLDMHLIGIDIQFGGNKIIVYFSAAGRVDFRELVKELASGLKSRVELKQIGARDEAKQVSGLGICGREFCCSSFLREFVPVSIKMAKNQNLALNPNKVSGGCGRLLCCLTYEDETYSQLKQMLYPKRTKIITPNGTKGIVLKGDILNQVMQIETESGEMLTLPVKHLRLEEGQEGIKNLAYDGDDDTDDAYLGSFTNDLSDGYGGNFMDLEELEHKSSAFDGEGTASKSRRRGSEPHASKRPSLTQKPPRHRPLDQAMRKPGSNRSGNPKDRADPELNTNPERNADPQRKKRDGRFRGRSRRDNFKKSPDGEKNSGNKKNED